MGQTFAMGSQFNPATTPVRGEKYHHMQPSAPYEIHPDRVLIQSLETEKEVVTYQPSFFFPYQSHTITCFSYVWDILRYDFYPPESDYKYYLKTDLYIGW